MRLAHVVPSLEDRHGGPSKSVRALAGAQAALDVSVDLLATSVPGQSVTAEAADDTALKLFPRDWPLRLCRSRGLRDFLATTNYDCVHSHALWLLPLRYALANSRRTGAPLVVSPRGMLSEWAYRHHHWRKRLASLFIHPGALDQADGWHATSAAEADDIRRCGFRQPVCVAPNGVTVPAKEQLDAARSTWLSLCPAAQQRPVALFYSRFHRKKRLRELLDLWLAAPRGDWLLLVAGVPEEYSVAEIKAWIGSEKKRESVAVFDGAGLPPPYAIASLFLLPSHSENFGLVIAEALAAGVPALVTDTTPWEGLVANEAGWCVPWNGFGAALADALTLAPLPLAARGARSREWVAREFTWERSGRLLLEFYRQLSHA